MVFGDHTQKLHSLYLSSIIRQRREKFPEGQTPSVPRTHMEPGPLHLSSRASGACTPGTRSSSTRRPRRQEGRRQARVPASGDKRAVCQEAAGASGRVLKPGRALKSGIHPSASPRGWLPRRTEHAHGHAHPPKGRPRRHPSRHRSFVTGSAIRRPHPG